MYADYMSVGLFFYNHFAGLVATFLNVRPHSTKNVNAGAVEFRAISAS